MNRKLVRAFVLGEALTAFLPTMASAQALQTPPAAAEEIIVTAQRREEKLEKTPLAVSVRSGDALVAQGKYSLAAILQDVPGINGGAADAPSTFPGARAVGSDAPSAGMVIRGIPSSLGAGGSGISTAPVVATYVDGVYSGAAGSYDLAQVEVLRGPQGTLYGRSSTAGVVAIHTRNPNLAEVTGDVGGEIGNYNMSRVFGAVSVPIITDQLAIRVAANRYQIDGFDNGEGGRTTNTDAKVKLLWKPSSDLSVLLGFAMENNEANSGGHVINKSSDPYAIVYKDITVRPSWNDTRQVWGEVNWDSGIGKLTYISAFRAWTQDGVAALVAQGDEVNTATRTPKDTFLTQELRLASRADSKLIWQVGALYYDNRLKNHSENKLVNFFGPGADWTTFVSNTVKHTQEVGVFGEATYPLTDALRLTAGLRYDYTKLDIQQDYVGAFSPVVGYLAADEQRHTYHNVTYHGRIEADLSPESIVYASVSSGFSPGDVGLQADSTGTPHAVVLKAETLRAYELGSKNNLLGGRLQVNGALFYNDYGGFQTTLSINPNIFRSYNVPLRTYGGELEVLYRPTRHDRLGLDLSYVNARFHDKPAGFADDFAADYPNGVVPFKANASYSHEFPLPGGSSLTLRGDGNYISARNAPATNFFSFIAALGGAQYIHLKSAFTGNLGATWASANRNVTISAYVRNVGDYRYRTTMNILALQGPPGFAPDLNTSHWAYQPELSDPRTFGVSVGIHF